MKWFENSFFLILKRIFFEFFKTKMVEFSLKFPVGFGPVQDLDSRGLVFAGFLEIRYITTYRQSS